MNNLVVITPAVLDEECIRASQESMKENLVSCNKETQILQLVHLDMHVRQNLKEQDLSKITEIYLNQEKEFQNYKVKIFSPKEGRVGLIKASHFLLESFLKFDSNCCFVFEDDTTIKKKIDLKIIDKQFSSGVIALHLSFGVKEIEGKGYSTEEALFNDNIEKSVLSDNISYYDRLLENKSSFTWNGTFFKKDFIKHLLTTFSQKNQEQFFPEDQIGRFIQSNYKDKVVRTLFSENPIKQFNDSFKNWNSKRFLPDQHFIFDEIRYSRGRVGAMR